MVVPWPVLKLSAWVRYVMEVQGGRMLLNGHHISQTELWRRDLKEFWDLYEQVDSSHPVFTECMDRTATLPYFLHGDEGRGRSKMPMMVLSFQGLFSHFGRQFLNESGLRVLLLANCLCCYVCIYYIHACDRVHAHTYAPCTHAWKALVLLPTPVHDHSSPLLCW